MFIKQLKVNEQRFIVILPWAVIYRFLFAYFLLTACSTKNDSIYNSSPKFKQYYLQGEQLYLKNCSNCHQKTGVGLGLLYPPLNKSDFMDKYFGEVICIIKNGKKGDIIVNGRSFNKPMPGISTLTNLEVAEIATYIYNTWEHKRNLIEVITVDKVLLKCDNK